MQLEKIGDLFSIEKGSLQSSKCKEGSFVFITAAEEWKTHSSYSHDTEALVFAAAASGSLGRTHYVNGKFIASDLCFILTPKKISQYPINLKFYHLVFNNLREKIVKATKTGTSKESINYSNLSNYLLPYFNIELQSEWIGKLLSSKEKQETLLKEIDQQQSYLQLLRQTILQEAVQGKLTSPSPALQERGPGGEVASELLKRIKAEKQKLIKEGKLRKEKELPPITEDEIPFELPKGWVWVRGDDVASFVDPQPSHRTPQKL